MRIVVRIVVFVAVLRRVLLRAGSADPVRGAGRSPVVRFGGFGDNRTLSLAVVTGRRAEPPAHFLLRPGDNVRAAVDAFARVEGLEVVVAVAVLRRY